MLGLLVLVGTPPPPIKAPLGVAAALVLPQGMFPPLPPGGSLLPPAGWSPGTPFQLMDLPVAPKTLSRSASAAYLSPLGVLVAEATVGAAGCVGVLAGNPANDADCVGMPVLDTGAAAAGKPARSRSNTRTTRTPAFWIPPAASWHYWVISDPKSK